MNKYSVNNSEGYTPMKEKKEEKEKLKPEKPGVVYDDVRRPSQADSHRDAIQYTAPARSHTTDSIRQ